MQLSFQPIFFRPTGRISCPHDKIENIALSWIRPLKRRIYDSFWKSFSMQHQTQRSLRVNTFISFLVLHFFRIRMQPQKNINTWKLAKRIQRKTNKTKTSGTIFFYLNSHTQSSFVDYSERGIEGGAERNNTSIGCRIEMAGPCASE